MTHYKSDRYINKEKVSIKNTWKIINNIFNNNSQPQANMINIDGSTVSNPHLIANHFNQYFVNIGANLSNQIPSNVFIFKDYLLNPNPSSTLFMSGH